MFASLDHLSGGRAAWNVVTSSTEAEALNFGKEEHLEHSLRYERAQEFVEVAQELWDSWEDDALLIDKESGFFADRDKLHRFDHTGKHFSVRGPLNLSRPPQGYPVIIQAGSSDSGKAFAAQTAEVVFTAQPTLESAQSFYAEIKNKAAALGRLPEHVVVMPGVFPIVGATEQEAKHKYDELQELILPSVGLALLSRKLGFDVSGYPPDGPLPDIPETNGEKSRSKLLVDMARRENMTIRQLYLHIAGARGHRMIFGTPGQIADQLEDWFVQGGADGFNIMPPDLPDGLEQFVNSVVPELQ